MIELRDAVKVLRRRTRQVDHDIAELLEAINDTFDQSEHIAVFSDYGWSVMHPVACRPDMSTCEYHRAIADLVADRSMLPAEGYFWVELSQSGVEFREVAANV